MNSLSRSIGAVLSLSVAAACGGGGGSPNGPQPTKLFAVVGHEVVGLINPLPRPGVVTVDRTIGSEATMGVATDAAYDAARDELYLATFKLGVRTISVFAQASTLDGGVPSRVITTTGLPCGLLYLDTVNDVLYLGGQDNYSIGWVEALEHASTLNGSVTPDRNIRIGSTGVADLAVDGSRAILYVLSGNGVLAFANAGSLDGTPTPDRTVFVGRILTSGLALDAARDTLYVTQGAYVDQTIDGVVVIPDASTASQVANPVVLGVAAAYRVDVDSTRDRLYVFSQSIATVIDHVSTVTPGTVSGIHIQVPGGAVFQAAAFAP